MARIYIHGGKFIEERARKYLEMLENDAGLLGNPAFVKKLDNLISRIEDINKLYEKQQRYSNPFYLGDTPSEAPMRLKSLIQTQAAPIMAPFNGMVVGGFNANYQITQAAIGVASRLTANTFDYSGQVFSDYLKTKADKEQEYKEYFGIAGNIGITSLLSMGGTALAGLGPVGLVGTGALELLAWSPIATIAGQMVGRLAFDKMKFLKDYAEDLAIKKLGADMIKLASYQVQNYFPVYYMAADGIDYLQAGRELTTGDENGLNLQKLGYNNTTRDFNFLFHNINRKFNARSNKKAINKGLKNAVRLSTYLGFEDSDMIERMSQLTPLVIEKQVDEIAKGFESFLIAASGGKHIIPFSVGMAQTMIQAYKAINAGSAGLLMSLDSMKKYNKQVMNAQSITGDSSSIKNANYTNTLVGALSQLTSINNPQGKFISENAGLSNSSTLSEAEFINDPSKINAVLDALLERENITKENIKETKGKYSLKDQKKGWAVNADLTKRLKLKPEQANIVEQYMLARAMGKDFTKGDIGGDITKSEQAQFNDVISLYNDPMTKIVANAADISGKTNMIAQNQIPRFIQVQEAVMDYYSKTGELVGQAIVDKVNKQLGKLMKITKTNVPTVKEEFVPFEKQDIDLSGGYEFNKVVVNKAVKEDLSSGKLDQEFLVKTESIATKLGVDPNWLLAIYDFETYHTFSPSITNDDGYVGLIQFGPLFYNSRGGLKKFQQMSAIEQSDYVLEYFQYWFKGKKPKSLAELYLAVAAPAALGWDNSTVIYTGKTVKENPSWDINHDGKVTKGELISAFDESPNFQYSKKYLSKQGSVYIPKGQTVKNTREVNSLAGRKAKQLLGMIFGENANKASITAGFNDGPYVKGDTDHHEGIDFGVASGTPVYSPVDGVVVQVDYMANGYGNYVVIRGKVDKASIDVLMAHMSSVVVAKGQKVSKGQVVAYSGNTGYTTGPHVHFEVVATDMYDLSNPGNFSKDVRKQADANKGAFAFNSGLKILLSEAESVSMFDRLEQKFPNYEFTVHSYGKYASLVVKYKDKDIKDPKILKEIEAALERLYSGEVLNTEELGIEKKKAKNIFYLVNVNGYSKKELAKYLQEILNARR